MKLGKTSIVWLMATIVCLTVSVAAPAMASGDSGEDAKDTSLIRAVNACGQNDLDCVLNIKDKNSAVLAMELNQLRVAYERARLADMEAKNGHANATLWAQHVMSWLILGLVFTIVGVGMLMSYQHMRHWFAHRIEGTNSLEVGKDGLKMNTPVIGLFIFLISTYFFSVYVDKVYTIYTLSGPVTSARPSEEEPKPPPNHNP